MVGRFRSTFAKLIYFAYAQSEVKLCWDDSKRSFGANTTEKSNPLQEKNLDQFAITFASVSVPMKNGSQSGKVSQRRFENSLGRTRGSWPA